MFGLRTSILFLATTSLLVVPAEATTSYYAGDLSQEASFDAAVSGLTLLNPAMTFSGSDLATGGLYNASGTGINFLGFDDSGNPLNFTVNSDSLVASTNAEQITVSFPATGVYALGMEISVFSGFGLWCAELTPGSNPCPYPVTNASNSLANIQFFGVVSDTPITAPFYVRPTSGSPRIVLPDFQVYSADSLSATPEPNTVLLAGLGLIILGLMRRKIRRPLQAGLSAARYR